MGGWSPRCRQPSSGVVRRCPPRCLLASRTPSLRTSRSRPSGEPSCAGPLRKISERWMRWCEDSGAGSGRSSSRRVRVTPSGSGRLGYATAMPNARFCRDGARSATRAVGPVGGSNPTLGGSPNRPSLIYSRECLRSIASRIASNGARWLTPSCGPRQVITPALDRGVLRARDL